MVPFIEELLKRRKIRPNRLAVNLGISHATISRWLSGEDTPGLRSCRKLADYSGVSVNHVFAIAGYLPEVKGKPAFWPEFREYMNGKYPQEIDEDLITLVEDLIERKRDKSNGTVNNMGK